MFSPDGEWVAFASSEESSSQAIYVMRPDGSEMRQVTDPPQEGTSEEKATINDSHPKWAPDGESLVFNRDGSEPRNISNHPSFDGYPAWLPESEGIVFASNRNGDSRFDFNLYVMRPDGSAETRLTETIPGVLQVRPQVSPNGTSIAFNRDHFNGEEDETTRIYIARFHRPISELMRTEEE